MTIYDLAPYFDDNLASYDDLPSYLTPTQLYPPPPHLTLRYSIYFHFCSYYL